VSIHQIFDLKARVIFVQVLKIKESIIALKNNWISETDEIRNLAVLLFQAYSMFKYSQRELINTDYKEIWNKTVTNSA